MVSPNTNAGDFFWSVMGLFNLDSSDQYRGAILPFRITSEGERKFAAPSMVVGLLDEIMDAGETINLAMTGQLLPGDPDTIDRITRLGMLHGGGGYLGGRLFNPGGATLGIFAGANAKTANKELMKENMSDDFFEHFSLPPRSNIPDNKMLIKEAEKNPDKVFKETGVFTLGDGRLRFEIDDRNMKNALDDDTLNEIFQPNYGVEVIDSSGAVPTTKANLNTPLYDIEEVISHPELFKAYPQLKNIDVQFINDPRRGSSFNPFSKMIKINLSNLPSHGSLSNDGKILPVEFNEFKDEILDVAVHEMQHAVDTIEGMPSPGGNTRRDLVEPLLTKAQQPAAGYRDDKIAAYNSFRQNFEELQNLSIAKLIKQYKDKSKKSNIKPSELRKQGEFYRYSDKIRSELGAPPKNPGAERDAYYQMAFNKLADLIARDNPDAFRLLNMETKNIDANIRRLQKAVNADRPGYEEFLDADEYLKSMQKNFGTFGYDGTMLKNFNIYHNILGEQVARAVQARRGATRVPGLFGLDKRQFERPDNPLDTFTKFYEPGSRMENILKRNPLNRVGTEYMENPPVLGLTGAFK